MHAHAYQVKPAALKANQNKMWKTHYWRFNPHIKSACVCVCHRKAGETLPRPEQQGWTIAGRRSLLVCSTMMSCRCLCSYYHPKWAPVSTYITIITTGWSVCNICWNARSKHWWRAPFYLATHSASFGCCEGHMLNRLMRGHKLKISYRQ